MNFVLLTLALAVVTGSQGFVLQDAPAAPSTKLGSWVKDINDAVDWTDDAVDRKINIVAESGTGKAISQILDEDDEKAPDAKAPAESQGAVEDLIDAADAVADVFIKAIDLTEEAEKAAKPIVRQLEQALAAVLAPVVDPFLEKLEPLREHLHHLAAKVKEMDHNYEENLKGRMAELDAKVLPEIQQWRESHRPEQKAAA